MSEEEQDAQFDVAIHELYHVYKDYGRFATENGIINLFDKFGFEISKK